MFEFCESLIVARGDFSTGGLAGAGRFAEISGRGGGGDEFVGACETWGTVVWLGCFCFPKSNAMRTTAEKSIQNATSHCTRTGYACRKGATVVSVSRNFLTIS